MRFFLHEPWYLGEQNNLTARELQRTKELQAGLAAGREAVGAQMPQANPDYDPARADELAKGRRKKAR